MQRINFNPQYSTYGTYHWCSTQEDPPMINEEIFKVDLKKYAKILAERIKPPTPTRTMDSQHALVSSDSLDSPNPIYWKCLISSVEPVQGTVSSKIHGILQDYFGWEKGSNIILEQEFHEKTPVRFCIEREIGDGSYGTDANGLIFIDAHPNPKLKNRIFRKLQYLRRFVRLPVVVILMKPLAKKNNLQLILNRLLNEEKISDYLILHDIDNVSFDVTLRTLVDQALTFLAHEVSQPPPIEVNHLEEVVFSNFLRVDSWVSVSTTTQYTSCLTIAKTVFTVYNEGLKNLKKIITDTFCYEFARFPEEFRQFEELMNTPSDYKHLPDLFPDILQDHTYRKHLDTVFDQLLPLKFSDDMPGICRRLKSNEDLLECIKEFCWDNFDETSSSKICDAIMAKLRKLNYNFQEDVPLFWTDFMDTIIEEKHRVYRRFMKFSDIKKQWMFYNNAIVVYLKSAMAQFQESNWFSLSNPVVVEFYDELN